MLPTGPVPAGGLRLLADGEIRPLAQFSSSGAFRPLKSAPNLPAGWRVAARDERALGAALHHLYPGAVADWFAAQTAPPPVTSYRQFTSRQTGMYRITTQLDDATAGGDDARLLPPRFLPETPALDRWGGASDEPSGKERHPVPGTLRHPARIRPQHRAPGTGNGASRRARARALRDDTRLPGWGMRFCGPRTIRAGCDLTWNNSGRGRNQHVNNSKTRVKIFACIKEWGWDNLQHIR